MKTGRIILGLCAAAAFIATTASCESNGKTESLHTGDLVFVGIPTDYSIESGSMDEAIASSTGEAEGLNLIHVAIAEVEGDSTWIIDATVRHGVDRHPLDTFLTDFTLKDGSYPEFIIKRLKDDKEASAYVENAKRFIGQPYDVHFLPENDSMYCSELVRDSYIGKDGSYVFESAPMNFKDADGEFPLYWRQLFALIGSPIPQGIEGTNPSEMSKSTALRDVKVKLTE